MTKVGSIMCSGMCAIPFTHVNFVLHGNNLRVFFANVVVDCNIVVDRKKNVMVHIHFQLIFSSLILCYLLSRYIAIFNLSIKKSISPRKQSRYYPQLWIIELSMSKHSATLMYNLIISIISIPPSTQPKKLHIYSWAALTIYIGDTFLLNSSVQNDRMGWYFGYFKSVMECSLILGRKTTFEPSSDLFRLKAPGPSI